VEERDTGEILEARAHEVVVLADPAHTGIGMKATEYGRNFRLIWRTLRCRTVSGLREPGKTASTPTGLEPAAAEARLASTDTSRYVRRPRTRGGAPGAPGSPTLWPHPPLTLSGDGFLTERRRTAEGTLTALAGSRPCSFRPPEREGCGEARQTGRLRRAPSSRAERESHAGIGEAARDREVESDADADAGAARGVAVAPEGLEEAPRPQRARPAGSTIRTSTRRRRARPCPAGRGRASGGRSPGRPTLHGISDEAPSPPALAGTDITPPSPDDAECPPCLMGHPLPIQPKLIQTDP
jgi:hypothetical protein